MLMFIHTAPTPVVPAVRRGVAARALRRWQQQLRGWACAIRGHDYMLHLEPQRLSLKCATCGHETCGWRLPQDSVVAARSTRSSSGAMRRAA